MISRGFALIQRAAGGRRRPPRAAGTMIRRGFTLLELMLALVVSSLAITLAYGVLRAGTDTGARAADVRDGIQARVATREVLAAALRHALPGVARGPAVFELTDSTGADGLPHDRLRFVTRGVVPPFGAGEAWIVSLDARETVTLDASTESPRADGRYRGVFGGVRGLDIRVLPEDDAAPWLDVWDDPGRTPRALSIAFVAADGRQVGPALVARIGIERGGGAGQ